jgi:hypothetical protein
MRKKRSLVPRTRESVNRQLDSTKDDGFAMTPKGDFSINPKLKNVRFDRLRCYKNGKTVLRIWNMLDPENPSDALLNGRLSAIDMAGLGGMSISEPAYCVQYAGIHKDTLGNYLARPEDAEQCSYIIARSKSSVYEGVGFWDEPYVKLYVTAKKARDTGEFGHGRAWDPKWNALMSGQNPALGAFKQRHFVVCSVYENGPAMDLTREHIEYRKNGKDVVKDIPRNGIPLGEGPEDPLMVLQLPISAGKKLLQLCCAEKQDWEGDENVNPSVMFKYGDPCGRFDAQTGTVKGGVFFTLYNPEKVTIEKNSTFRGILNPQVVEYEAAVSKIYTGPNGQLTADLSKEQVDNILSKHLFFWKESDSDPEDSYLLHEPSIEERCLLIVKAFKQVPKLLEFCWMSNPEYLNFDSVQAVLKNRKVVSVQKPDMDDEDEDEEDEIEEEEVVETPPPAAKTKTTKPTAKPKTAVDLVDEFEDEEEENDDSDDSLTEDDAPFDDEPVVAKKSKSTSKQQKPPVEVEDDFDDEEEELDEDEIEDEEVEDDDDFEDDDEVEDEDDDAEEEKSDDFDDEVDNSGLQEQLNNHLSKAKGLARSSKRSSTPAPKAKKKS